MCHSQPESRCRLKIQKYDMCDAIKASDHRPVAAAINITIKEPELGKQATLGDNDMPAGPSAAPNLPESACLMRIRIHGIHLKWKDHSRISLDSPYSKSRSNSFFGKSRSTCGSLKSPHLQGLGSKNLSFALSASKTSADDVSPRPPSPQSGFSALGRDSSSQLSSDRLGMSGRSKAHTCIVYFPLHNEDPLSHLRKGMLMNQALNVGQDSRGQFLKAKNIQHIHTFNLSEFEDGVLEFKTIACPDSAR